MQESINKDVIVVLVTCPGEEAAQTVADHLVMSQVAACVNIIPKITSIYTWKGQICRDSEYLLIIKARASHFDVVRAHVLEKHPYEVPEIIALPVTKGHDDYLNWVYEVTAPQ